MRRTAGLKIEYRAKARFAGRTGCFVVIRKGRVMTRSRDYDGAQTYVDGYRSAEKRLAEMSREERQDYYESMIADLLAEA